MAVSTDVIAELHISWCPCVWKCVICQPWIIAWTQSCAEYKPLATLQNTAQSGWQNNRFQYSGDWNSFGLSSKLNSFDIACKGFIHRSLPRSIIFLFAFLKGGDGGWKECVWSESQGKCYSPTYLPMAEVTGSAGRIVRGSPEQCMANCIHKTQCSTCFQSYNCGWCGEKNSNGKGLCMIGGLRGIGLKLENLIFLKIKTKMLPLL